MANDYEPAPIDEIELSVKFPGNLAPLLGGTGWAFVELRLKNVALTLYVSDASMPDSRLLLEEFLQEVLRDQLPASATFDEEGTDLVLAVQGTEHPEVVRFSYDNLENLRGEALVKRTPLIGALKAALATLGSVHWDRRPRARSR